VTVALLVVASAMWPTSAAVAAGGIGNDISWPQCGQPLPAQPAFAIVGVNDGRPETNNPCLAAEYRWAAASGPPALYMNTANPGRQSPGWYRRHSPDASCAPGRDVACAYNYGYSAARAAFAYANAKGPAGLGHTWWLDVETSNSWSGTDLASNVADITGALGYLRARSAVVGIYSTRFQWGVITGGAQFPELANWVPGAGSATQAATFCSPSYSFSGGPVLITQYVSQGFDYDYACPGSGRVIHPPSAGSDPIGDLLRLVGRSLNGSQP
jgi:hypothetical protein